MTHANYAADLSLETSGEKGLKLWLPYCTQTTKGSLKLTQFSVMYIPICGFTYFLHICMGLWVKMFSIQAIRFSIAHVPTTSLSPSVLENSDHNLTWTPNQNKTKVIVIFFETSCSDELQLAYLVWNRPNPCVPAFTDPSLAELTQT